MIASSTQSPCWEERRDCGCLLKIRCTVCCAALGLPRVMDPTAALKTCKEHQENAPKAARGWQAMALGHARCFPALAALWVESHRFTAPKPSLDTGWTVQSSSRDVHAHLWQAEIKAHSWPPTPLRHQDIKLILGARRGQGCAHPSPGTSKHCTARSRDPPSTDPLI